MNNGLRPRSIDQAASTKQHRPSSIDQAASTKQHRPSSKGSGQKGSGQTSLVEGLNNKWRNRVSGLVRKTVCVRYLEDLERRLWLVLEQHNQLCIKQLEKMLAIP